MFALESQITIGGVNMYDVIVIGGGVVGTSVLREVQRYNAKSLLLEMDDDVATGTSRANSGIVHAGYDCTPGTLKAKFNVRGNKLCYALADELGIKAIRTGSLVVANKDGYNGIKELYDKGIKNGVDVEIIGRDRILELEKNVADDIEYALYAKDGGIISPYKFTIALADNAVINGAEVKLNSKVTGIEKEGDIFKVTTESGEVYESRIVVNSAGGYANDINAMLNDEIYDTEFRRGDYFVLDVKERKNISTVLFPLPDERGKGILVAPTVDGNVIYGPTSIKVDGIEHTEVSAEGLDYIKQEIKKSYKCPNYRNVIRVYAGVRSIVGKDFVIKWSDKTEGFYILAGICSPGLTSAPAIGEYVAGEIANKLKLSKKDSILPNKKHLHFAELGIDELEKMIKKDSRWGRIVCRCEKVSEAEIVEAIHSPVGATTVDAVKRRARAGMGRCGGGFCAPDVMNIIARELNIPVTEVRKGGKNSNIAVCEVKEGEINV